MTFALLSAVAVEGDPWSRQPWIPVLMFLTAAVLPAVNASVAFPGDLSPWIVAHVLLVLIVLCARFFSYSFLLTILRVGMVASVLTLLGGSDALSVDERSLFFLDGRLRGIFGHPNMTGLVAVAALFLTFKAKKHRIFDVMLAAGVIAAAMSLTSLIAGVIALGAVKFARRDTRVIVFVLALCTLFVPFLVVASAGADLDPNLFTGRVGAWQWVLSQNVNAAVGLGIGLFPALGQGHLVPWFHAHNEMIMDYVSGGWPLAATTFITLVSLGRWATKGVDARQFALWVILIIQCFSEVPLYLDYPSGLVLSTGFIIILILRVGDFDAHPTSVGDTK